MTELTAAILQLSEHAERIAVLDTREAAHWHEVGERLAGLATRLSGVQGRVEDQGEILRSLEGLDVTVAELADQMTGLVGEDAPARAYRPIATPRWWQLEGDERAEAITRLRHWVGTVFRPGYGHLARALGPCWEQHDLCLYLLDWLSELWSVLYLPGKRGAGVVAGQAEWQTRWLVAAADQLAAETSRCVHAKASGNGRPANGQAMRHG